MRQILRNAFPFHTAKRNRSHFKRECCRFTRTAYVMDFRDAKL